MRALPVVMLGKGLRHLVDLFSGLGTMPGETLFLRRPVISFNKAMLLRMLRLADEDCYPEGVTEADQGRGKVRALRCTSPPRIAIQRDGSGQSLGSLRVRHGEAWRFLL